MGLISWLASKFGGSFTLEQATPEVLEGYFNEVHIREVAFWSTVNIIANAVSKCEFKTYVKNKETKGAEHYLWNVEPNKNQNSSVFIHKWISQLYKNNECLIIEQNGQLLVADDFIITEYALFEDVFTQVKVKNFTFDRPYKQSEVLYFKLSEKDMKKVTNALYDSYVKLLSYSMKAFQKSRGTKGIFNYETLPISGSDERKLFDALINEKFKKFMDSGDAVLPLGKGQSYTDIGSKTYSSDSTRDIRAMIDDISDFTAKAFGVPPTLLRGDVQGISDAVNNLLTFCIDPLCDMLEEEINRKRNGLSGFTQGTYLEIDTKSIKHIDLLSVSTAIDKLIASGAFCINDIRKLVGEPVIDEDWAWQHWITKNYSSVEDLLNSLGGDQASNKLEGGE